MTGVSSGSRFRRPDVNTRRSNSAASGFCTASGYRVAGDVVHHHVRVAAIHSRPADVDRSFAMEPVIDKQLSSYFEVMHHDAHVVELD